MSYFAYLKSRHEDAGHLCDLVAHFFRRAFTLLRQDGCLGLIATNTIAQGDTRKGGLAWLSRHGWTIYFADKRVKWPGRAAVIVCVVCGRKGHFGGIRLLNGKPVSQITAFLFHAGGDSDPIRVGGRNEMFRRVAKSTHRASCLMTLTTKLCPISLMRTLSPNSRMRSTNHSIPGRG